MTKPEQASLLSKDDHADFDEQMAKLAGYQEVTIKVTIPIMYKDQVESFLANGERKTAAGLGIGILKRCGLL